jgi:hypothetical protein
MFLCEGEQWMCPGAQREAMVREDQSGRVMPRPQGRGITMLKACLRFTEQGVGRSPDDP